MNRIRQFIKSFSCATRGLAYALRHENNFQNELVFAILVVLAMVYYHVTRAEMIVLFLVIMVVLIMELMNTVVERVADILKPRVHPYVRLIKDLMAASVLVASIFAVIIGLIIFIPYIIGK